MEKFLTRVIFIGGTVLVLLGIFIYFWLNFSFGENKKENSESYSDGTPSTILTKSAPMSEKEHLSNSVVRTEDLTINQSSDEKEVVDVMHKMTHQKVKSEEKQGAIEMTMEHINFVYNIVANSQFQNKDKLLDILNRWKKGDFHTIVDDHNYLWTLQGGKIGKAYGVMSAGEEKEFVLKHFPNSEEY